MSPALLLVLEWSRFAGPHAVDADEVRWRLQWEPDFDRPGMVAVSLERAATVSAEFVQVAVRRIAVAAWAARLEAMPATTDLGFAALRWAGRAPRVAWVRACHLEGVARRPRGVAREAGRVSKARH